MEAAEIVFSGSESQLQRCQSNIPHIPTHRYAAIFLPDIADLARSKLDIIVAAKSRGRDCQLGLKPCLEAVFNVLNRPPFLIASRFAFRCHPTYLASAASKLLDSSEALGTDRNKLRIPLPVLERLQALNYLFHRLETLSHRADHSPQEKPETLRPLPVGE